MTGFRYEIPLSLTLRSPFVTRGIAPDRATIDTPLARDAKRRIMLPGTLIQGVVRAALGELCHHLEHHILEGGTGPLREEIVNLFGRGSDEEPTSRTGIDGWKVQNEPRRGQLSFGDLVVEGSDQPSTADQVLTRIQIDAGLGSAREGFLQVIELPYAQGDEVVFSGKAHLRAGAMDAGRAKLLIERALALVPAIGAVKSAGFGKLVGYEVEAPEAIVLTPVKLAVTTGPIAIRYKIDRPFLIGSSKSSGNLFRGDDVIPGAAIKGVLAEALKDAGLMDTSMGDWLAELTISHAFPGERGNQAPARQPLPRSLAVASPLGRGDPLVMDRLLAGDDGGRIDNELYQLAFSGDWKPKDQDLVAGAVEVGAPSPRRDVRTRTKIDPKTGTSAFEQIEGEAEAAGQLFSYSAVCADEHDWHGWLMTPTGVSSPELEALLGLLEAGVIGFGKTSACLMGMEAALDHGLTPPEVMPVAPGDRRYAVTLLTPALLNDQEALRSDPDLFSDYAHYWENLGFRLHDFYAGQCIEGGYVALRYPQRDDGYEPYLLTEPGSVFLIEPEDGAGLDGLLLAGLPPNKAITRRDWESCPYLSENGFGMIRCNRIDHAGLSAAPRRQAA